MEPVVVGGRERHVRCGVHVERGRDVDNTELGHAVRMIECHTVRDPSAAVVSAHEELINTDRIHHRYRVIGHRAFAVAAVVSGAVRFGRSSVAAEVEQHDEVSIAERVGNAMPHDVRFGKAMQQQQRPTVRLASDAPVHRNAVHVPVLRVKAFEPPGVVGSVGGGHVRSIVASRTARRVRSA